MQLLYSQTSPYARKVRAVIEEKQLQTAVELSLANPLQSPAELLRSNPLSKVPALICDDGVALYDSQVICEYLDDLGDQPRLIPATGAARWTVLRQHALANGLLDAAVAIVFERNRADAEQSTLWLSRWQHAIERSLSVMADDIVADPTAVNLATLSFAVALGYLDFRHPDIDWRAQQPPLAEWYAVFSQRPSLQNTQPPAA